MKHLSAILVMLAVFAAAVQAQEFRGAEIGLDVSNQVDPSTMLVLGVREGATSGLDLTLEEYELPPVPPNEIFDARVISTPGQSSLGLGGVRDYRAIGSTTEAFSATYTIAWQVGEGASEVLVTWSDPYPGRVTAMTIDGEDMQGKSSWTSSFLQGQATVRVTYNYVPLSFSVTPPSVSFDLKDRNNMPSQELTLVTRNDASASWTATVDVPWLEVTPAEGNGGGTVLLQVVHADLANGDYPGTLSFRSPLYGAQLDVSVSLSVALGAYDAPAAAGMSLGNSPNPFAGRTTLHVRPLAGHPAVLRVFDALGRLVADLSAELAPGQGTQRVLFDAGVLPPGVYTLRLDCGSATMTRSMVLLK